MAKSGWTRCGVGNRRLFWRGADMEGHRLSIYRQKRGCYWLFDDPDGHTRRTKHNTVAGPFKTVREGKVRYLLQLALEGKQ